MDNSKETEQIIKEQLETLAQLADAHNKIDSQNIEASLKDGKINDDLKVPITKIIDHGSETHVVTKEGSSDIVDITKLDFSTFLAIYAPVLMKAFGDDQTKIMTLIEESQKVYGMLAGDERVRALPPYTEDMLSYGEETMRSNILEF